MLRALLRLMQAPPGLAIDFTQPAHAPALAPADGVSWRIFSNPVSLFIGGVSAVLLELAEPRVRTGVWEHSSFRSDPLGRLHRTGYAAMVTVYAPRAQAESMIAHVVHMHEKVRGTTPDGQAYSANTQELLDWVQATAIFGFTQAYSCFVRPMTPDEKDQAFAEGQASASLYGAHGLPNTWQQWEQLLAHTSSTLEGHAILAEFIDIMCHSPILPGPLRPLQLLLVKAAVHITPSPVREMPPLQALALRPWQLRLVRTLAWLAERWPLPMLPPAQARQRMQMRRR